MKLFKIPEQCSQGLKTELGKPNSILLRNVLTFSFHISVFVRLKKLIHGWSTHSYGPDNSKTERNKMVVSLDHFIHKQILYLYFKHSRLTAILFKIAAILFVLIWSINRTPSTIRNQNMFRFQAPTVFLFLAFETPLPDTV